MLVGVQVAVGGTVPVGVLVGVRVTVEVGVLVGVGVPVGIEVLVGVRVGVLVGGTQGFGRISMLVTLNQKAGTQPQLGSSCPVMRTYRPS